MPKCFLTLQARLVLLILLVSLPGMVFVGTQLTEQRERAIESIHIQADHIATDTAATQTQIILATKHLLQHLAKQPSVIQSDPTECSSFLRRINEMFTHYVNLGIPRTDGELLCNALPLKKSVNVADRPYIQKTLSTRDFAISEFQLDRAAGVTSVNFSYPVINPQNNELAGAVVAVVSLEWWSKQLEGAHLPEDSLAYIVDSKNTIVAHYPENNSLLGTQAPLVSLSNGSTRQIHKVEQGKNGHTRLYVSRELIKTSTDNTMNIVIGIPIDKELNAINDRFYKTGLGCIAYFALFLPLAFWAARVGLIKPITNLTTATKALKSGKLPDDIDHTGIHELAILQDQFSVMAKTRLEAEERVKQRELELQDSESYNRSLFEKSPIGLVLSEMDGTFVDVNPAFASIIGLSVEEALHKTAYSLTPEKYRDEDRARYKTLQTEGMVPPFEKEYYHKDGHLVSVRISAMILEQHNKHYVWASVENITEKKRLEEQIRRAQKMEAIGLITGGISHDFNNILGIIIGNTALLKQKLEAPEPYQKYTNAIERAAFRAANLTSQLLGFSRKRHEKEALPTNINEAVRALDALLIRSMTPKIKVEFSLADDIWLTTVDPGEFDDSLLNLVINAKAAIEHEGSIQIETANRNIDQAFADAHPDLRPGQYVEVTIKDTGTGIPSENLERIFEPFFTTKPLGKGTGLGLAMVYGFVQRSKGAIVVSSEPGLGTTFRIYLPRTTDAKPIIESTSSHAALPRGDEKILVVDDEEPLLNYAQEVLEGLGYQVVCAQNGPEALKKLADHPDVSMLFSDVVMPGGIDGYQLAEQASLSNPELKIVLTSGFAEKDSAKSQTTSGQEIVLLSKPYHPEQLAQTIRSVLDT